MGKVMIFSEMFEIRELIAQDLAAEGHMVVATGNPVLIQTLIPKSNPDLVLLDLHLSKVNPGKVIQHIRKKSPRVIVLPFTTSANAEGNIRLLFPLWEERGALSLQDFKSEMNMLLNPRPSGGQRLSARQSYCQEN